MDLQLISILDAVAGAVIAHDNQGQLLYANASAARLFGVQSAQDILQTPLENLLQQFTLSHENGADITPSQLLQESDEVFHFRHQTSGEEHWFKVSCQTLPAYTVLSFDDVTDLKRSDIRSQMLLDVSAQLAGVTAVSEIARVIVNQVFKVLGGNVGSVSLLGEDGRSFEIVYSMGINDQLLAELRDLSLENAGPMGDAILTGKAVWIENHDEYLQRYPAIEAMLKQTGSQSVACLPLFSNNRVIGGIGLTFKQPHQFSAEDRFFLTTLARKCAQAIGHARAYEAERTARLSAEVTETRMSFLAQATVALSSSLDYEATLKTIIDLAVPHISDWCAVELVQPDGSLEQVAVKHIDPAKTQLVIDFRNQYPPTMDKVGALYQAINHGKSDLVPYISQEFLEAAAPDENYLRFVQQLRLRSVMLVPMILQGKTIGLIGFISAESERRFDETDVKLAEELARRAAVAVENARLYRQAQEEINRRQQVENELRVQAEQMRLLTDSMPALISYIDKERVYRFANNTYEQWFKQLRDQIHGKSMKELLGEDAYKVVLPRVETALSGETIHYETWINYAGAGLRYIHASYIPDKDEQQQVRGFFVLVNDMSERKRAEERAQQLQQVTMALSQALTVKDVGEIIMRDGIAVIGSDSGAIYQLMDDGQTLELIASKNVHEENMKSYTRVPLSVPGPLTEAIREQKPVFIESGEHYARRYPNLEQVVRDGHLQAAVNLPFKVNQRMIGGISASFHKPHIFSEEEKALYMSLAQQCGQALERAELYEAERKAREQAERARERFEYLARASAELSSSLDYEMTLTSVTHLAVPTLADWCAVDLLVDGALERLAVAHVDPEKVKWSYEINRKYPPDPNSPAGTWSVLRGGKPVFLPSVTEEMLVASAAGDPERLQIIREIGFRAAIIAPVAARGRIFGAITLVTTDESGRDLTSEDLALAEELGLRAGIAIDNARLYQAAEVDRERLQVTLTSIGDGVVVTDNQGRVTFLNPVAQELTGWSQADAAGQPLAKVFNIVNEYTRELVESPVDKVLREGMIVGLANHTILINKNGGEISIDDSGAPIRDHEGDLVGVVLVFRDISERRDVERQKELVLEQERRARVEAERADRLKLRFLGMISHELRTPLASIKGFTTTLLATDVQFPPDEQNYFLNIVNIEADRLHNLIEHLLDLSSLEAGTLSIYPEKQTISGIIEQAQTQLNLLTREHEFNVVLPPELPPVSADPQRIVQVIVNLVGNAAKYCPPHTPITLTAARDGDFVRVDISDNGPGIPVAMRPYVFEAFRRVEDTTLRLRGAGLGLAICKGLIENHHGRIWIDDAYTGGTRMSFTLPVIDRQQGA